MTDWLLWIAIIVLILLPPSLDPAVRFKMRQVLRGDHPESRGAEWIAHARKIGDYYIWFLAGCIEDGGFYWVADDSQANRYPSHDAAIRDLYQAGITEEGFSYGAKIADAR